MLRSEVYAGSGRMERTVIEEGVIGLVKAAHLFICERKFFRKLRVIKYSVDLLLMHALCSGLPERCGKREKKASSPKTTTATSRFPTLALKQLHSRHGSVAAPRVHCVCDSQRRNT